MTEKENNDLTAFGKWLEALDTAFIPGPDREPGTIGKLLEALYPAFIPGPDQEPGTMTKNENNDLTAFGKLLDALDPCFQAQELNNRFSRLMAIAEALARLGELDPESPVPIKIRPGIIDFMREFLSAALAYHKTTGKRSDLKAAEFLKSLGVATGKNKKATGDQLFIVYYANVTADNVSPGLKYLFGPPDGFALDPDAALEAVAAEFGLKGPETALQQIRAYIRAELKIAEKIGLAESFKKFIDSLNLPGNPPWSYK